MKKRTKVMAAAIAMMTLSTAASITGTVAWFTANNIVSAQNMTINATSEKGIVIAPYSFSENTWTAPANDSESFDEAANAAVASKDNLLPTWSNGDGKWYHANSKQSANGQVITTAGYKEVENTTSPAVKNYYLENHFALKSTGGEEDIYVKELVVTRANGQSAQAYDDALRVMISTGDITNALVYAPFGTHSGTETISGTIEGDDLSADKSFTFAAVNTLVLNDVTAQEEVVIYIWFDGQDAACKSDNIPASVFNTLTVSVKFGTDNE